ncbi:MAG TPA: hypothetical protein VNJ08_04000 [Bacteriovoracaceae bacterium]|nr:hypothetical protein [Bacteriovoracaceae bacterium]
MTTNQIHRKKWLCNPAFQFKLTGFFVALALINLLFFAAAVNWYFHVIQAGILESGASPENPVLTFIVNQRSSLNIVLLGLAIFGTPFMFVLGIWLSNKVAGPIYRVTQDLNNLDHTGEQKIIKFREGDFFNELRDALNSYLERSHHSKTKNNDDNN